jgi:hypothetical protein
MCGFGLRFGGADQVAKVGGGRPHLPRTGTAEGHQDLVMDWITHLSRLVVTAQFHLTTDEQYLLEPELSEIVQAFNDSERGKFAPLGAYAFDGDRAKALEVWMREELRSG